MPENQPRLARFQWWATAVTALLSAVAIGLAFSDNYELARIVVVLTGVAFAISCYITYQRWNYNRQRRSEILAQLDADRDRQLIEVFDKARLAKNLPPDAATKDGFSATVKDVAEKAADYNLPPGVKKRGGLPHE